MEKNDKEKLLIDDIRSLFELLKEEEKGRYQPGTGFMKKLLPSNYIYAQIAEELIDKAFKLSDLNNYYDASGLASVLNKEIMRVRLYKLEYDRNKKVKDKSVQILKGLMHDATYHIRLYFMEVLGDIDV